MEIFKEFRFEVVHQLSKIPAVHQCGRLHGHSFFYRALIRSTVAAVTSRVRDFVNRREGVFFCKYLNQKRHLDDVAREGVRWFARLFDKIPSLHKVVSRETYCCGCLDQGGVVEPGATAPGADEHGVAP